MVGHTTRQSIIQIMIHVSNNPYHNTHNTMLIIIDNDKLIQIICIYNAITKTRSIDIKEWISN